MLAYDELQQLLRRLGVNQDAAEYHGALCGMLCHGDLRTDSLIFDDLKADDDARAELAQFSLTSLEQLELPEFLPVLPADEEKLFDRVEALASWCGGFLYGLGSSGRVDIQTLSEEVQELMQDFTEISRAGFEQPAGEEGEEEERAYTELVEYVRVGAQLIFLEMHPRLDPLPAEQMQGNTTLH